MGKILVLIFCTIVAFAVGVQTGWDTGVRDAKNLNQGVCSVSH